MYFPHKFLKRILVIMVKSSEHAFLGGSVSGGNICLSLPGGNICLSLPGGNICLSLPSLLVRP